MMHLFLSPEAEQKMPRPTNKMMAEKEVSSLSSSSSEENLTPSPLSFCSAESVAYTSTKSTHQQDIVIVDKHHALSHHQNIQQQQQQPEEQHGLCL
jgi:hypothetical protein